MAIRVDAYGGYSDEKKPDPDHCYSWKQENYETPQEFALRISEYILNMVEQLAEEGGDDV